MNKFERDKLREQIEKSKPHMGHCAVISIKAPDLCSILDSYERLVKTLEETREAICQNATDTLWMHEKAMPNCTVVDYIDLALTEAVDEK